MAAELGGVPVSAPGAMSSRTDQQPVRDIPASYYGEGQEMRDIQAAAPMAATPAPPKPSELFAPTQRPDEPVTSGVDMGPGVGSAALAPASGADYQRAPSLTETLRKLSSVSSNTERLAKLLQFAEKNGW
jgi:hypothetical protein